MIVALNITKSYDNLQQEKGDRVSVYDCVRKYWRMDVRRAQQAEYVVGVAHGKVEIVCRPISWSRVGAGEHRGRLMFEGDVIKDSPYLERDVSERMGKGQCPVRYWGELMDSM